jgi:hypothetical protein
MKKRFPDRKVIHAWVRGAFQSSEQANIQQHIRDTVTVTEDKCDIVLNNKTVPFDGEKVLESLKIYLEDY